MFKIALVMAITTLIAINLNSKIIVVKDLVSGDPLENARITDTKTEKSAFTNSLGIARINDFSESENIVISLIGYERKIVNTSTFDTDENIVFLRETEISLGEVVVSASRRELETRLTPISVSIVKPELVRLSNPQTSADLLGISGKVFIQKSQQGGGSPMIRGFSTNRLLINVDGIRMNNAIFRSGNLQNVISIDNFSIDRTEVLFGPGSVMYGSDAIGGVMSFYSLKPKFSLNGAPLIKGSSTSRYSSANNEFTGHFDLNVGWENLASVTSVTYNNYGDIRMGSHGPTEYLRDVYVHRIDGKDVVFENPDPLMQVPTAFEQSNIMQKFKYMPDPDWDISYGFFYSATSDYARYDRHIRLRKGLPRSGEWEYGPQKWMMNNIIISNSGSNAIYDNFDIRLAYQNFEESRIDRDFNDPIRRIRIEKVDAYSLNLDFEKKILATQKLTYGIEGVMNHVNSTGYDKNLEVNSIAQGMARYPKAKWASYSAYLTYQNQLSQEFTLNAGARYNQFYLDAEFDTTFYKFPFTKANIIDGAVTGSLGINYNPNEELSMRALLSSGFRSPNVDDLGKVFDSEPGSVVVPNPDLRSENAYNAEIGVSKIFSEFLKFDLSIYYTILENALVRRDYTLNGQDSIIYNGELSQVQAIQNAANANVWGIQVGIELKLSNEVNFSSIFNFQKGREELDNGSTSASRHAAPAFGTTRFSYEVNKLRMDLYSEYNAEVTYANLAEEERGKGYLYAIDKNGNPYSPGWYTLNFKAMYRIDDSLTIISGIENLTDQRYRPYSSGIVANGRNIILSLRTNF